MPRRAEALYSARGAMKEHRVGSTSIELVTGDIARQAGFDAVVNAANAQLRIGGGVAGALHRAAGPGLEAEARPHAPIRPGEAVMTSGHRLSNRYVIHCFGPVYGVDEPADELLASCYHSALDLAEGKLLRSIAFPAISTGAFGYPLQAAARIALRTVLNRAPRLANVQRIRFVLYDDVAVPVHEWVLSEMLADGRE